VVTNRVEGSFKERIAWDALGRLEERSRFVVVVNMVGGGIGTCLFGSFFWSWKTDGELEKTAE